MGMSMKNKSSKICYGLRPSTSGLKFVLFVFCLMLVPFDLLSFVTGTTFADTDNLVEYNLTQDQTPDSNDSSDQLSYQLWKSNVTGFDEKDAQAGMELNRLIQQVRAIKISAQLPQQPEPVIVPKTTPSAEPNETPSAPAAPQKTKQPTPESKPAFSPVTEKTLKVLRSLSHNFEKIENPLGLGEVLFLNGDLKEAAEFYQEALNRIDPNDPDSAMNRAWLIFQKANCLRNDDRNAASKLYGQLITEYPNSLWAQLAQIQNQIILWYQKDEPQKLIDEVQKKDLDIQ
jgi:tetratricopeptide (TPR) repeat protein